MDTHRLSQTVQPLLGWFQAHARALPWRADREPYHVWLSEIMLQQTRVEAVRGYYARFLAAAPDVFALAALVFSFIGSEFTPQLDERDLAVQSLRIPSTPLEQSLTMQRQVEAR